MLNDVCLLPFPQHLASGALVFQVPQLGAISLGNSRKLMAPGCGTRWFPFVNRDGRTDGRTDTHTHTHGGDYPQHASTESSLWFQSSTDRALQQ